MNRVGGLSFIVSLSMAEIAAALPTAGGIYYWSYRLGGPKWGYDILIEVSRYLANPNQARSCRG